MGVGGGGQARADFAQDEGADFRLVHTRRSMHKRRVGVILELSEGCIGTDSVETSRGGDGCLFCDLLCQLFCI